jgi:hypothetical protein
MIEKKSNLYIYVPHIIVEREEASKYIYDWYNWPNWSNWGRRAQERKTPYILAKKYSL